MRRVRLRHLQLTSRPNGREVFRIAGASLRLGEIGRGDFAFESLDDAVVHLLREDVDAVRLLARELAGDDELLDAVGDAGGPAVGVGLAQRVGERLVGVRPAEQRAARAELHAEEHGREGERALRDQSEDLFDLVHDFPFCSNSRSR